MSKTYLFILLSLFILSCGNEAQEEPLLSKEKQPWDSILAEARGQQLTMVMWQGDPNINAYMKNYVAPTLMKDYGVQLSLAGGQGNEIVQVLMAEMQAGKQVSDIDLMWINGETYYQLKQIKGLYGPFVDRLPNAQLIDWENPMIAQDFQQPVDGMECPWGNVQQALIYNTDLMEDPPKSLDELEAYLKAYPGTFTIPEHFTGTTLLKAFLISLAKNDGVSLMGEFDEALYKKYSAELWERLGTMRPYFWNKGQSFPKRLAQMHQLFSDTELHFTMSNNDKEVDNKILNGQLPKTAKAYVLESGTIQNSHYLGISKRSAKKAAAMVVCNFLISPEAQLKKQDAKVWGDGTVLDVSKLSEEMQMRFKALEGKSQGLKRAEIADKALMEPAAEYMIRLERDFREFMVN
jgi:putative spermidine/putrescine transport system substrate-binding protein